MRTRFCQLPADPPPPYTPDIEGLVYRPPEATKPSLSLSPANGRKQVKRLLEDAVNISWHTARFLSILLVSGQMRPEGPPPRERRESWQVLSTVTKSSPGDKLSNQFVAMSWHGHRQLKYEILCCVTRQEYSQEAFRSPDPGSPSLWGSEAGSKAYCFACSLTGGS